MTAPNASQPSAPDNPSSQKKELGVVLTKLDAQEVFVQTLEEYRGIRADSQYGRALSSSVAITRRRSRAIIRLKYKEPAAQKPVVLKQELAKAGENFVTEAQPPTSPTRSLRNVRRNRPS